MDFLTDLERRGLVNQTASPSHAEWPPIAERLASGPVTAYVGIDPTADSLHVGHFLQVVALMRLQRAGHRPIAVVGGGTGMIGDPSFKATERSMLTADQIGANVAGIRAQLEQLLDFDGPRGALLFNNLDWLGSARLIEFLRDVGKHFSVNQMITRDSVTQRLSGREHGISFTEFSYALLQAYDFAVLHERHGCELQIGGSDQFGNIVDGIDLIRRLHGHPAWGLTLPLITKADGTKFGKTETGTVWLDPERTRPYAFYQFWFNANDDDALRYLRFFTFLPWERIDELAQATADAPQRREAQRALAAEIVRMVHGDDALASAQRATAVLFEGGDLRSLSAGELADAFEGSPRSPLSKTSLGTPDASLVAVLADSGLEPSRGRARKAVESGAVSVNGAQEKDVERVLTADDLLPGGFVVLRRGKKTYHVIEVA